MSDQAHRTAPAWFITGTDTEVGKTFATCALLLALKNGGQRARQGAKHIGLGISGIALGAEKLIRALSQRQRGEC